MSGDHAGKLLTAMWERVSNATVDSKLAPLVADLRGLLSAGDFEPAFVERMQDEIYVLDAQDDARRPEMPPESRDDAAVSRAIGNLERILQEEVGAAGA